MSDSDKIATSRSNPSQRSGIFFPVGRISRLLREGRYADHINAESSVYLAAVLEYLSAELLELAGVISRNDKSSRINPRHLEMAIRTDAEFDKLLSDVTIVQGGVITIVENTPLKKSKKET